jgi:hypothetical protein
MTALSYINGFFPVAYVDAFTSAPISFRTGAIQGACPICPNKLTYNVRHSISMVHRNANAHIPSLSATKYNRLTAFKMSRSVDEPKSMVNDFKPSTMTLTQSMIFFVKYLIKHRNEQVIKRQLVHGETVTPDRWPSTLNIRDIGKADAERLRAEVKKEQMEKRPLLETLKNLNDSRKELIELVGYDANLLVSCFGFAVLAAFMNSVIPHYYGQSVNCLANAMSTTRPEVMKALTGLGVASVLCALFTGIRGALFWLAGKFRNHCNTKLSNLYVGLKLIISYHVLI